MSGDKIRLLTYMDCKEKTPYADITPNMVSYFGRVHVIHKVGASVNSYGNSFTISNLPNESGKYWMSFYEVWIDKSYERELKINNILDI